MSNISKQRLQKLAGLMKENINEGEVVDLMDYKREKEREDFSGEYIMSPDGDMITQADDFGWKYVIVTSEDQKDALVDGDIEKAAELGAKFYELAPGEEIETKGRKTE